MKKKHAPPRFASHGRWDVPRGKNVSPWKQLSPPELFIGSFLLLILLGTLGLKTLPGIYTGAPLGWQDAVFTATSAVCVTGLIVVDTATFFTPGGQAFLLLLIQLGGLGMLAFTSMIIAALGGRLSLRTEMITNSSRQAAPHIESRRLLFDVVRFTLLIEAIGALALYVTWVPRFGWDAAIWPAIFHSVSAFCNAGFSTNTLSLIEFQGSPATLTAISLLIIVGGIGFLTLEELFQLSARRYGGLRRLSVHSRLVLVCSAVLLIGGWVFFAIYEWNRTLADLSLTDKLVNSAFLSVTARTAGFNSIDYAAASDVSNFLTILLMMVGGSPGSTAGGMKTTTIALLALLAWSRLRSRKTVTVADRSVPPETIDRAVGLAVVVTAVVVWGIFCLASSGRDSLDDASPGHASFLAYMFEAVSAFNTVGLSMGLTPELSPAGRWVVIALMFIGRVGPLSLAAALIVRLSSRSKFRLAYEDVIVG